MRIRSTQFSLVAALVSPVVIVQGGEGARTPAPLHFVFFDLDRHRITDSAFLHTSAIAGAQLKYTWRELEPERDRYELRSLLGDLQFLRKHGKRLFVQLQDVSFEPDRVNVPHYLLTDSAFHGGAAQQFEIPGDDEARARPGGWVARRWDPAVRDRFVRLLRVLSERLDGKVEGINLSETAVEFGESGRLHPSGFTYEAYLEGVKAIMTAAREAFPRSRVIQYANFMPGEWLPSNDRGFLRVVYAHANRLGSGVGGPDLLPYRKGQQDHSYPLIAARGRGVVAGCAVQWGNLRDRNPITGEPVTVDALYRFARDQLRLDYIFWGTEEPYYSASVIPYIRAAARR